MSQSMRALFALLLIQSPVRADGGAHGGPLGSTGTITVEDCIRSEEAVGCYGDNGSQPWQELFDSGAVEHVSWEQGGGVGSTKFDWEVIKCGERQLCNTECDYAWLVQKWICNVDDSYTADILGMKYTADYQFLVYY